MGMKLLTVDTTIPNRSLADYSALWASIEEAGWRNPTPYPPGPGRVEKIVFSRSH